MVLPWPNAIVQEAVVRGRVVDLVLWMGGISHQAAATTAGPCAVAWLDDRFAGRPAPRTCDTPPPVAAEVPEASAAS